MPDSYDPDSFSFYTIEETVRTYNNFTKRKIRKFRQCPARLWELPESGQDLFHLAPESDRRGWIFVVDMSNGCKELFSP